jgi:uridine kinase
MQLIAAQSPAMELIQRLVAAVDRSESHVAVGIDGPDAAGKTTLADRLASALARPVVRLCADDFLRPRADRYRRGELSPEGYYRDSVDHAALADACRGATPATIVADGIFLLRPELRDLWTLSVYVRVPEQESLRRARVRDGALFGSADEVERRYRARYLPGQALYRAEADPESVADVLVDNTDPAHPVVLRWSSRS